MGRQGYVPEAKTAVAVHALVQGVRVELGLREGAVNVLIVDEPHDGRADDLRIDVDVVLPVLEGDSLKDPDAPGGQPDRWLGPVPNGHPALGAEAAHDSCVLDVHLLEDLLGQLPVALELVGEPVVVELPRVGGQVKGVVLGALAVAAKALGEHVLQVDRLVIHEGGPDDIAADGHRPIGAAKDVTPVHLVGNNRRLVDNDVHVLDLKGTGLEVEQDGGVTVDNAALGQDLDRHLLRAGHDLGDQRDGGHNRALLVLRRRLNGDMHFNLILPAHKDQMMVVALGCSWRIAHHIAVVLDMDELIVVGAVELDDSLEVVGRPVHDHTADAD